MGNDVTPLRSFRVCSKHALVKVWPGVMAKGDGPVEVMPAAELKPLLVLSKRQAVGYAIGMTRDKQGVVLLHRRKKPRKLMAELLRQAKAAGADLNRATMRFGRATVDGASDSSTVHFTVNKHVPDALRVKLLERLRPVGFQHCDIVVDEDLESESEDGEEAEAPPHRNPVTSELAAPEPDTSVGEGAPAPLARQADASSDGTATAGVQPFAGELPKQDASGAQTANTRLQTHKPL